MKSLLAFVLIVGGVSYFNFKSETESEKAVCSIAQAKYSLMKEITNTPYASMVKKDDNYYESIAQVYVDVFMDCTIYDNVVSLIKTSDLDAKVDRFNKSMEVK
jgi:hypothetical protein